MADITTKELRDDTIGAAPDHLRRHLAADLIDAKEAEIARLIAELKRATEKLDTLRGALRTAEQPRPHNLRTLR